MNIEDLKKTYQQLVFIHQILTQRTQYYLDEFDVAKDSARTITDMANKLAEEIHQLESKSNEKTNIEGDLK